MRCIGGAADCVLVNAPFAVLLPDVLVEAVQRRCGGSAADD